MARRRKVSSKPTTIADASKEKPTTRHKSHKTNGLPEDNPNGSMSILDAEESQEEEDLATSTETNSLDYSQSANSMKDACESSSTTVVHKKFGKINCLLPEGSDSGTETEDPVLQLVSADGSPSPIHDEEGFSHQQDQDMLSNAEEDASSQDEQVMLQNDDEGSSPQEEELMLQNDDEGSSTHDEQVMVQMVLGDEQEHSEGGDEDTETFVVEVEEGIMGEISQEDTVIVEVVGDDLMYSEEVGGTIWQVQSVEESENGYVYQDSEDVLCEVEACEEEACEDESESREDLVEDSGDPPAIDNGEEMSTDIVSSSISINKQNETDIEVSTSCVNHVQLSIDSDISDREVEEGSSAIQNKLSPDEITQMVLGLNCGSVDVNIEHQLCEAPEVSPKHSDLKNCESGSSSRDSCVEMSTRQRNGATHVYDRAKKVKSPKSNKLDSAVIPRNSVQSTPPRKNVICLDESPLKTPSNLGNKQLDSTEFDLPISSIGGSVFNADLNSLNDRDISDKRVDKQRVVETGTSQSKKVKVIEKSNESEPENKKVSSFRNRSGSSDTTGSESGSRSPVVRRSTRIRVPTTSKSQSDDKGVVDSSDSSSENPPASSVSVAVHSSANSVLISDTSMPVKVKSRWRRSSELEMGGIKGSDGDTGSLTQPMSPQSDPVSQPSSPPPPHPPMPPPSSVLSDQERMERREQELREIAERLKGYENLKENLYLTERTRSKEVKRMICDCPSVTKDEAARGEMGCGEDCLNKLLMIECGSRCVAKDRCSNKKFQNADYARCEIFKTDRKGFGLRAMEDLPGGTFIMEYVGEVLDPKEFRKRAKEYSKDQNQHYYFMALKSDAIIDATNKGNNSRFINHSCDPNAETQKWTVNGELRIGFFTTKAVAAGEEITFDYQFQRYGKEAQRCYCESSLCRGWIGGDPNKEKSRTQWQEWKDKDSSSTTKKKRDKDKEKDKDKRREDIDLEEEIEKLCTTGLKSRAHTLTLCRLMVRAEDIHSRTQMLRLLQDGEPACCRLFLDYHGLKLMWSWMIDTKTAENIKIKTEILRTLKKLPIPNKTMLIDSKVLTVVDRWSEFKAKVTASPPDNDRTPEEESSNDQSEKMEVEDQKIPLLENSEKLALPNHENGEKLALPDTSSSTDVKLNASEIRPSDSSTSPEQDGSVRIKEEEKDDPDAEVKSCAELAALLVQEWSTLKEVFRIPKKERIEQMKEHEREADEHYRDGDRYDRYDRRKKRSRESPDHERSRRPRLEDRDRDRRDDRRYEDRRHEDRARYGYGERTRYEERDRDRPRHEDREDRERERNVDVRLSKEARRKAFALKVQQEEEQREARRVQAEKEAEVQKEWWRFHAERYLDPHVTAALLQTQFVDPITNQWLQYPLSSDPASFPADIAAAARLFPTDPSNPVPVPVPVPVPSHLPVTSFPGVFPVVAPGQFDPSPVGQPVLQPQASAVITVVDPSAEQSVEEAPQVAFSVSEDPFAVKDPSLQGFPVSGMAADSQQPPVQYLPVPMPIKLPPKWKSAKDAEGRVYYYHVKTRISQWEPPPWPQVAPKAVDSESSSSSTDEDDDDDDSESTEEEEKTPKGLKESVKPRREKAFPCLVVQEEEEEEEEEDDEADMPLVVEQGLGMAAHHQQHMRADPDYPNFSPRPTVAEERRKRRAGLVQEHIISPRREEDRTDPKIYKEIKEKLRRQKEKRRQRDREGKSSKRRHRDSDKSRTIHSLEKPVTVAADTSSDAARRIKDQFRLNMAGVIVTHLNPYRKPDCRMGRITNTEDFKHLARKLTHFVMLKELKHCRNVDDLECNDNVKHKARDFIKKYMAKFGDVYQRPKDDD